MKRVSILLLGLIILCSCSEEEGWTAPPINRLLLTEARSSSGAGEASVTKKEEYVYQEDRLASYLFTQESTIAGYTEVNRNPLTIQYEGDGSSVTFTDGVGTQRRYTFNSDGYATECNYHSLDQERQYTFSYTDGYLTLLTETILPRQGSDDAPVTHTLTLAYDRGDLVSVTYPAPSRQSPSGYEDRRADYTASETPNYYSLPCLDVAETYPLSFHREALFAGMLGKATEHLTLPLQSIATDAYDESTIYSYELDEDNRRPVKLTIDYRHVDKANNRLSSYRRIVSIAFD